MKACGYHGKSDIRYDTVPDPTSSTHVKYHHQGHSQRAICGSDLHIYDGVIPEMEAGDVLGHESMGEVVESASASPNLGGETGSSSLRDRVRRLRLLPPAVSTPACERSNPDADKARHLWGNSPGGCLLLTPARLILRWPRPSTCASPNAVRRSREGSGRLERRTGAIPLRQSFPPASWRLNSAASRRATRTPYGAAAGRSVSRSALPYPGSRTGHRDRRGSERLAMAADAGAETIVFMNADVYDEIMR